MVVSVNGLCSALSLSLLLFEFSLKEQSLSIKRGTREKAREVKDNSK